MRRLIPVLALLLLACDLSDPSIRFDQAWWDPIGMRGTVSYAVQFDGTFLPAENLLGRPGQYLRERWQSCFSPHYGATFLGGARAAFDYTLDCVGLQGRGQDPYVQHHVASMELDVESAGLWLVHVARNASKSASIPLSSASPIASASCHAPQSPCDRPCIQAIPEPSSSHAPSPSQAS